MRIIVVDDEKLVLEHLAKLVQNAEMQAEVYTYTKPEEAIEFSKTHEIDIAFLDIKMPHINGITLAKELKSRCPNINIIFTTGYSEYAGQAFSLHASGYLLKPATMEDVKRELSDLRFPVKEDIKNGIVAKTFGNFDFYVNAKTVTFKRSKSKELLAYLICKHGTGISKREACSLLFHDDNYTKQNQDYLNKILMDLKASLKEVKADSILCFKHNYYAIVEDSFKCDLYDYEKGYVKALNSYHGEFINQYPWAKEFQEKLLK